MEDVASKGPMGLNGLSAVAAAEQLDAGAITSEALVRDCLERIEAREATVYAWDYIDADHALAQAKALDAMPRRSPLHGVPVGIKDIFDTDDMPTGHGFGPYQGVRSGRDSNCVGALRKAGMVIMGKTVTTEFACPAPRHTTNPHDPTRTPGVSSSGSAASVADFMVPLANGSQTGGSVIAPAACCGVYGFKASLDGIDRGGFRHCKASIDTIGLFARSLEDLVLFRSVQTGEPAGASVGQGERVRIGMVFGDDEDKLAPDMAQALAQARDILEKAGAEVRDVALPRQFRDIVPDFSIVNGWEAAEVLADEIKTHYDRFNDHNRARIEFVRTLTLDDYREAGARLNSARQRMGDLLKDYDVFLSPSQAGEAPVGLSEVHSANFARLWTQMHTPSVNLALFVGAHDMPLGLQVIGPKDSDARTLAMAAWIDTALRHGLGTVPAKA